MNYKKVYPNAAERLKAITRFIAIFRKINEHNVLYEAGFTESSMGINKFADMTSDQVDVFTSGNVLPEVEFGDQRVRSKAVITVTPNMFPAGKTC